jgi:hypothetical protein
MTGHSASVLARRWNVPLAVALNYLFDFRDVGLASEAKGLWHASPRAVREFGWMTGYGAERERQPA